MLIKGFNGRIYKGKTFNHIVSTLHSVLIMLEKTGTLKLPNKPSFHNIYVKEKANNIPVLSDGELMAIKDYLIARANDTKDLLDTKMSELFIINTNLGLRPAELLALRVGDIDFTNKTITISRALKTHASIKHIGSTKNGVSRTLPIDGATLNTLAKMVKRITTAKEVGLQESYKLYASETDSELKGIYGFIMKGYYEWLRFKDLRDCPLTRLDLQTTNIRWRRLKKELKLNPAYTLYTIRHTLATRLVTLRKFSSHKLMSYLGHTSIQTSLKYVHLNVDDIRDGYGVGIS